jgi:hypothetical protein
MLRSIGKNLFLLSICSAGVVVFVAREFSQGLLSSHGFRVATLIVALGMGAYAVFIIIKYSTEYRSLSGTAGGSEDGTTRNRRLMEIRVGGKYVSSS